MGETTRDEKADNITDLIRAAANEHGLSPELIAAIILQESAGNPRAVSPAGAKGLMQLMPAIAKHFGVSDPFDPSENIRGGVALLKEELERFHWDLQIAVAAYNAGSPRIRRAQVKARRDGHGLGFTSIKRYVPMETQRYVEKVLENIARGKSSRFLAEGKVT